MAIDKITLDATKCILAARLRGCNAPFWRIQCGVSFPTEPVTISILSSLRKRPQSRTHAYYSNTPRAPLHVRCLITRRTGYRPAPVRRAGPLVPLLRCLAGTTGWCAGASSPLPCRYDGLVRWCPHQRGQADIRPPQAPPPRHSGAGRNPEPTPTIPTHAPNVAARPVPHHIDRKSVV